MEKAKLILDFIAKLIWPGLILVIIIVFYKQIKQILEGLSEFEFWSVKGKIRKAEEKAKKQTRMELKTQVEDIKTAPIPELEKDKLLNEVFNDDFESMVYNDVNNENRPKDIGLDNGESTMLAFAVGVSLVENRKYRLYYDPAGRRHSYPFKYIGLYNEKTIKSVGQVVKVAYCDLIDGHLVGTNGFSISILTQEEQDRIISIIEKTEYYDIREGHKFYLVDDFYETYYHKETPSGIRAKRYFWLNDILGFKVGMKASELATLLNGLSWY